PDFTLYSYGGYEQKFLRRIRRGMLGNDQVERALAASVNVLSVIYSHVYFPTWSNGLKDVARYLGFTWSSPDASGIQSIVWRRRWEHTRDEHWKAKLLQYNIDDCQALKIVTDRVDAIANGADIQPSTAAGDGLRLTHV